MANIVSASAKATRRVIGATRPSWPGQREQASEALGQPQRAYGQHEPADVRQAARRDRHCGRVSDEHSGDAEREGALIRRFAPPSPKGEGIAGGRLRPLSL